VVGVRLDDYAVDPDKLAGVWWDFSTKAPTPNNQPHAEHICFRIVPRGPTWSSAANDALDQLALERRRGRQVPPDEIARTFGAIHAKVTLVDWANVEMGTPPVAVPYSVEAATEIMTMPRWELVRRFVESAFNNESALLADHEEEARGN
jgi:hypothetical protein